MLLNVGKRLSRRRGGDACLVQDLRHQPDTLFVGAALIEGTTHLTRHLGRRNTSQSVGQRDLCVLAKVAASVEDERVGVPERKR